MSNKIKVDTTKIDGYISTLNRIIESANILDGNMISCANWKGYNNVKWTLNNEGSLADFIWRLKKDVSYLTDISTKANYVEQLLSQINPLNYAESIAIQQSKFDAVKSVVSVVSKFRACRRCSRMGTQLISGS